MRIVAALAAAVLSLASCTSAPAPPASGDDILIVVNAPLRAGGIVAEQIANGAQLAVDQINDAGGVVVGSTTHRLTLTTMDSQGSPATAADNVRQAIRRGVVAIVDEGTGVDASWQDANRLGIPIGIVYQGGDALVDPVARPNVYRIAPAARTLAGRLAEYVSSKRLKIAIVTDDSQDGREGLTALELAFSQKLDLVTDTIRIPATSDATAEIRRARTSKADALLIWAKPRPLAAIVRAARAADWKAPIYAAAAGEDPIVRAELTDHPEWVDGIVFAGPRPTGLKGPEAFGTFRAAYEKRFGADTVGVRQGGIDVLAPPVWAMYSHDFVRVVANALAASGSANPGSRLLRAMNAARVAGANGDERTFDAHDHEGVADDGVFVARFHDFVWRPVTDDPASAQIPPVDQLAG